MAPETSCSERNIWARTLALSGTVVLGALAWRSDIWRSEIWRSAICGESACNDRPAEGVEALTDPLNLSAVRLPELLLSSRSPLEEIGQDNQARQATFEKGSGAPNATMLDSRQVVEEPFPDGSVAKGMVINGVREGSWNYFNKDGILSQSGYFLEGKQHAEWTTFHPSTGFPHLQLDYNQGSLTRTIEYNPESGRILKLREIRDQEHGDYVQSLFYENAQIKSLGRLIAGKMEEHWTFWEEDGAVNSELTGFYRAGERVSR